jgi:hypothetical protein
MDNFRCFLCAIKQRPISQGGLALGLTGSRALPIWSVLTCPLRNFITLAGIAGETKRLKVLDAVSATLADRDNVIHRDCRLPTFGEWNISSEPPATGTMRMLCQQIQPFTDAVLTLCLDQPRPTPLGKNMCVALLASREVGPVAASGEP